MAQNDILLKKHEATDNPSLATAEIQSLIRTNTPFFITQGKRLTNRFDRKVSSWQEKAVKERSIHCRKGCGHCCSTLNWVTLSEALLLSRRLEQAETRRFLQMDRQAHHLSRSAPREHFYERYRLEIGSCPLLTRDFACRLHNRRPLSCRSVFSFFPSYLCRADIPQKVGYQRLTSLIRRHPSDLYHDIPFAFEPIIWRDRLSSRNRALCLELLGFHVEGALPTLISLLARILPNRNSATRRMQPLWAWIRERQQSELLSIDERSTS